MSEKTGFLIALAIAVAAFLIFVAWQLGQALQVLAGVLIGALSSALIIAATALPIRAWKKNDAPPVIEKHTIHEGRQIIRERVLDGRAPSTTDVKLLPLPAAPQAGVYPELLRAAYQAGQLGPAINLPSPNLPIPDPADPDEWGGDITG